jgi:hypothetical protein
VSEAGRGQSARNNIQGLPIGGRFFYLVMSEGAAFVNFEDFL